MQVINDDFCSMFERFLQLPTGDLERTLSDAADLVASALEADKVDVFVYQAHRSSLVALGTSYQPLSALQRQAGLDVLPLANGGCTVQVFETHEPLLAGSSTNTPGELRGMREILRVESQIAVILEIGRKPYGVLLVVSQQPNRWGPQHLSFTQAVARWVGIVAHRAELMRELERRSIDEGRRAAAEELVTMVAHDLRNYLSPLGIRLDQLGRRAETDGREEDSLEISRALKSFSRISAFVSELLDVARLDRDLFELSPEPLDVVSLVQDVVSLASTTKKRVRVKTSGKVVVVADPLRIRQCLENLIANALTHTPPDGVVTVQIATEPGKTASWARIEVIDEGPGIAEHLLPHIFDRFVSEKRAHRGLGLGLYIAKRIATLHRGDLTAGSALGGGARFVLTLPLMS